LKACQKWKAEECWPCLLPKARKNNDVFLY
jgi:hypothetical protein